jgi:hypothetical protein
LTDEYNPRGRYELEFYCGFSNKTEKVAVDDLIPVKKGTTTPIFAKPHGNELWVALLEKAFAKFLGDYQSLDGGYMLYGQSSIYAATTRAHAGGSDWMA